MGLLVLDQTTAELIVNQVVEILSKESSKRLPLETVKSRFLDFYVKDPDNEEFQLNQAAMYIAMYAGPEYHLTNNDTVVELVATGRAVASAARDLPAGTATEIKPAPAPQAPTPAKKPFRLPRSILPEMQATLSAAPLFPSELAERILLKVVANKNMVSPQDEVDRARIMRLILDKIARAVDGKTFQFVRSGSDRDKIRFDVGENL